MDSEFKPPLAIHFVWHPSDRILVDPILNSIRKYVARDVDRPFSRELNIPLFFYSSETPNCTPSHIPIKQAERDVIFIFTSVNTVGRDSWIKYIEQFRHSSTLRIVPVAIDRDGLQQKSIVDLNFIRAYTWPDGTREQHAALALAHEVYRYGFVEVNANDKGKSSSIKIFLSHAKAGNTGRIHAERIKAFIDNTNMSRFFDSTEISPGFKFDEEIIKHIGDSTLVSIHSDMYSSRYWCQREILCAKEQNRPIIAVDCLEHYEDRVFPASSNIPCVHVPPDLTISEPDILRILIAAILETIRHHHALKSLEYYQSQGWIYSGCALSARPPEIRQVISLIEQKQMKICYPEPSIYVEESGWLNYLKVDACTPLLQSTESDLFNKLRVGVSISDVPGNGYENHHLHADHLSRFSQDIARHLLARSAILLYGGDLRKDGFTQFILDEAIALKNRNKTDNIHVENHLAWPLYITDAEITAWRAKYSGVIKVVEHKIPGDIFESIDKKTFIPPNSICNKYIWSRCLTEMRQVSVEGSDARICAGGKLAGYAGKMPGVLEEIVIAVEKKKPIYLLGAFGGVVEEVCKSILESDISIPLTEKWQISNNIAYQELQDKAATEAHQADYFQIKTVLEELSLTELATHSGLCEIDYVRVMQSPFIDECIHLIVKGLKEISLAN